MVTANEARGAFKKSALNDSSDGVSSTPKQLLSTRELAAALNVSERTVQNWCSQKKIPRLRLSNRLTRFSLPRVLAALGRFEIREIGRRLP